VKILLLKILLVLSLSFSFTGNSHAENMKKLDTMNVHYMAIGSTFFTPEIAKAYGITRSRYNGLVNISVLDNTKEGTPAKTVSISGKAKNNLGQFKTLEFKEVKEGDAIYYLAQVSYNDEETLHFTLNIFDGKEQQQLKFSQKFYVD
jgi:large exoprotein involved in heme utilization and adhesion